MPKKANRDSGAMVKRAKAPKSAEALHIVPMTAKSHLCRKVIAPSHSRMSDA